MFKNRFTVVAASSTPNFILQIISCFLVGFEINIQSIVIL